MLASDYWLLATALHSSLIIPHSSLPQRCVMNSIWQDARFGFRMLWKRPGFTSVALVVLALGRGANTAIFSVVNAVLLRPLPYPGAERVVAFTGVNPPKGITSSNMSSPDFSDWLAQQTSFEALSLYTAGSASLTGGDEPERV